MNHRKLNISVNLKSALFSSSEIRRIYIRRCSASLFYHLFMIYWESSVFWDMWRREHPRTGETRLVMAFFIDGLTHVCLCQAWRQIWRPEITVDMRGVFKLWQCHCHVDWCRLHFSLCSSHQSCGILLLIHVHVKVILVIWSLCRESVVFLIVVGITLEPNLCPSSSFLQMKANGACG